MAPLHFVSGGGAFNFANFNIFKFYRLYPMVIIVIIINVYSIKQASALDFRCKLCVCVNLYKPVRMGHFTAEAQNFHFNANASDRIELLHQQNELLKTRKIQRF